MTDKACPRCGALYQDLKSTTCPQCFARLILVDEQTAKELAQARAEIEASPEFQEAKAEDDERFREQSFGACLGVAVIVLLTAIVSIALVVHAYHRYGAAKPMTRQVIAGRPVSSSSALPALPVAAATTEEVLPPTIGPFARKQLEADVTLPGTLTPIDHALYALPADPKATLDVYALPASRPTTEQNAFSLGITLAAGAGGERKATLFFATQYWHYAAVGDSRAASQFSQALLSQMSR